MFNEMAKWLTGMDEEQPPKEAVSEDLTEGQKLIADKIESLSEAELEYYMKELKDKGFFEDKLIDEEIEEIFNSPLPLVGFEMNEETPQTVVVKEQSLDSGKIKQYVKTEKKEINYEPSTLDDYVGQSTAKRSVQTYVKIVTQLKCTHMLINGWAGCGKTLLAKIIAKMLKAKIIYRIPEQLSDIDELLKIINQIQESEQLTVLFVDEIHNIDKKVVNILLPILQDRKFGDTEIRPFIFIGATTDKDVLCKKYSPLVSRFQSQITLKKYNPKELIQIIKTYHKKTFSDRGVLEADYKLIAENSRGIPREAIALLLKQLVLNDMGEVLSQSDILKDGLTKVDVKILTALNQNDKPMGASFLSQAVGVPQSDYVEIYERFLVEKGYILRLSRGRTITEKGKGLLNAINK